MPSSWNETKADLEKWPKLGDSRTDYDGFRRQKYRDLADFTGRPLIVYATDFLNKDKVQAAKGDVSIDLGDREGVREVTHSLKSKAVDFIIHSPGGSPDAADTIVKALRRRFEHVRIILPGIAKSAAAMVALSGHELLMEADAEMGPIDPQMGVRRGDTTVWAPAQAIIDQFEKAQKLIGGDPTRLGAWIPILQQYGPALYQECRNAIALSKKYVREWLVTGMLKGDPAAKRRKCAARAVNYLGSHNRFKTHGARVGVEEIRSTTLPVKLLNDEPELCERVMAVYQAIQLTFAGTGAYRLWENSQGGAYIRAIQQQQILLPLPPGVVPVPVAPAAPTRKD
jgi:hypothetical protein